jgi:hypothetical protein
VLSPLEWEVLVLVPVVGVAACFAGLRLYERLLRHHHAGRSAPVSPPSG